MIDRVNNVGAGSLNRVQPARNAPSAPITGKNFSEMLAGRMEEISRLQQTIPTSMDKNETALQTLLSIQSKLLEAYKEICAIGI
jgi:flagellar hook-basal body complex protein FliE